MNPAILHTEVQRFIRSGAITNANALLFKKDQFPGVSQKELATQIGSRNKCEKKLPLWFETPGIYYPAKVSVEQASSQLTASYKARLISGSEVYDLTGGTGVDSFYFSKVADRVHHFETDRELSEIARFNSRVLGAHNISFVTADGVAGIEGQGPFNGTVYIDPSRRTGTSRVFLLKDCIPNVPENLDMLLQIAKRVIVKTSPLLDLQAGLSELKHVYEIHILSVKNECRELIWVMDAGFSGETAVVAVTLGQDEHRKFSFFLPEEKAAVPNYSTPLRYLYEPDAAILKAGAFKLAGQRYGLYKLHKNTHLYTSENLHPDFQGKIFEVSKICSYRNFINEGAKEKANVVARNFPLTVEQVRKKHRIFDGGEITLFFTTSGHDEKLVIKSTKI